MKTNYQQLWEKLSMYIVYVPSTSLLEYFPSIAKLYRYRTSREKQGEPKCTSCIHFPSKFLCCAVLVLLGWNNREMFFPWVDRWLRAFYLKVLRERIIDVWTQHSILHGQWGTQLWVYRWVCMHTTTLLKWLQERVYASYWLHNILLFILKQMNFYVWHTLHIA